MRESPGALNAVNITTVVINDVSGPAMSEPKRRRSKKHSASAADVESSDATGPSIDRDAFVAAMRKAASSVSIVTTAGRGGRFGVTVSAMSSVSADPPTVLVCVNTENFVSQAIERNDSFCVNLLSEEHTDVSDVFAGRQHCESGDRFDCAEWTTLTTGCPALIGATAAFDCLVKERLVIGSHQVFVGVVVDTRLNSGRTLVYHDRKYCRIAAS